MNKKPPLWLALTLLGVIFLCYLIIEVSDPEKNEPVQESIKPEQLIIQSTEPSHYGTVTILDGNGDIYFQYTGDINLLNNGLDGEDVDIQIQLPSATATDGDTVYTMPIPVLLYDKTGKSIGQYMTHPEWDGTTLKLKDSEQTYLERDVEWDD